MSDKTYIDKLTLVILHDRKVLFVRSKNQDVWFSPGGKREGSETDEQALKREIKEELDLDVHTDSLKYYGTFEAQAHGKPEGTFVKIACYTGDYDGNMQPQSEIAEYTWFISTDGDRTTDTGRLILHDLREKNLID